MNTMYVCAQSLSCSQLFLTTWTVAFQAALSMKFSRQEYWSGFSFPSPGDLPNGGSNLHFLHLLNWRACMLSHFSHVRLLVTPWTVACQASLSIGESVQSESAGRIFTHCTTWQAQNTSMGGDKRNPKKTALFSRERATWKEKTFRQ